MEELEVEVEKLRAQLSKAKGVNDAMWDTVVSKMVTQPKDSEPSKTGDSENSDQAERRRKRGRAT